MVDYCDWINYPFPAQVYNPFVKIIPTETATPTIQIGNRTQIAGPVESALSSSDVSHISLSWWQIAAAVWLAGMIAFLVYHTVKHYRFMKMTKRWCETITDEQILSLFQNLKAELGISKQINLYQCLSIGTPMLIGFFQPKILLPTTKFPKDELRFILNHELVHYKRKDLWYRCLVLSAKAIHWFNPLVYLMAKAIDALCEMSCDAEVVRSIDVDMRQQYSEAIIGVVQYQSKVKTALSTSFYGGKKGMKERISLIMDAGKKRVGVIIAYAILLLTLSTGVAFAVSSDAVEMA
ncbi:M56 family metallopeptidase [Desulfitobacterium sp. PCE1]|uniref:M56 family metallopeptidase n=1 Tax=Desulfitobacterium sp. PCE1 TaxID=146907 RepID=UPI0003A80E2C|nr:M56 family metallopeptidase [Desulfitobacterium sp. PCE1]